ncbi:MAG TPA: hypothetical protein VHI77_01660 [Solirubrobacterales bacterium]|nr:hypothetical protein [Solirubrobacterales bacterium]
MLAYLFWHRPGPGVEAGDYEEAQRAFHAELGIESACFQVADLPFEAGPGYEDWYLVADWRGLGELNAAAVDARRGPHHDLAAAMAGQGWGGVYAPIGGPPAIPSEASWATKRPGQPLDELLAPVTAETPVWRRQLVLGPAPEICVGSGGVPRTRVWP